MSQSFFWPPAGSNTSVSNTGAAVPSQATLIGGKDGGGLLKAVLVDTNGAISVNVLSTAGATEATLQLVDTHIVAMSAKLPATIGQKAMAASLAVAIATDQSSIPVTGTFFQATQPISAASLPLPTGAATETTLAAVSGKLPATLGQKAMVASLAVALASDQSALPVTGTFFQATQPISAASLPLPSGAATETTLAAMSAKLPATLGQKASTASMAVVIASDQSAVSVTDGTPTARTVTQAAVTVGTTAVRLTVSGSAPASTRRLLVACPDPASTATFYIGSATVTNSGATRGMALQAGQSFTANFDAGDYYIVSSTAAQTVLITEQA